MKAGKMTPRWRGFCEHFVVCGDVTKAYMANYTKCKSENGAHVNGTKLLKQPEIQAYIKELMDKVTCRKVAEAEEILAFLTVAMRDNNSRYETRIKAAELLGKRYRLFVDKVEAEITAQVVFVGEEELED